MYLHKFSKCLHYLWGKMPEIISAYSSRAGLPTVQTPHQREGSKKCLLPIYNPYNRLTRKIGIDGLYRFDTLFASGLGLPVPRIYNLLYRLEIRNDRPIIAVMLGLVRIISINTQSAVVP